MPDAAFAAEMAALEEAHRANRPTGDGLAIVAPRFMHFDGARVTPPLPLETWYDRDRPYAFHAHDDVCLVDVEFAPAVGEPPQRPVGIRWARCQVSGVYVHDHGGYLFAHLVGDPVCPVPG